MENVLEGMPQVSKIETGVTRIKGHSYPYIQYHYSADGPSWRSGTVRLIGDGGTTDDGLRIFTAHLSGLFTPGTSPATFGIGRAGQQWQNQCKVIVYIFFM